MATLGKNQVFEIKNGDGTPFHNLVLRKSAVESVVMSLGDKISGDVYYKDNSLSVTMHEYITYNGVNYMLVNPPTIVREGIVSDNSELKGMTKYSFVFYHPMCLLSNFPFTDVAVTSDETRYLSESKVFSWIGKPADFVAKMNKNLDGTEWIVEISSRFPQDKLNELSDVIPFDNATIADACKTFYDTWGVPYVVDKVASTETSYATGKRFKLVMGLPSNEIYANATAQQQNTPFVFQMGHGVGLKNNSRTPRNNKIITRISGYGSENNIPYGYPQVRWYGTAGQVFTYGDHAGVYNDVTIEGVHFDKIISYPIYKGILDGEYVELIKHPFTRTHLMPSVYRTTLFNKISFYDAAGEANTDYDPDITLVDYYDAVYSAQYPYPNTINLQAPSYESHEFEDEKPELGEAHIISATPLNNDLTPASSWDDSLDDEGNYKQSYFQMVLPQLSFDLYACASITEEMQINMRSGACLGCTFTVQVDWDDYKRNFYDEDGNFAPNGSQRDLTKYPKSDQGSIALVLQKDNSTFGTLMPNMYQYPQGETSSGAGDGDTFVILGISLPESYIFAAEWRLDADMKSYMLENNVHYFDYPLKFDEDFLFHNENILSQIRPNTIVRFNYAGQTQALFVKQITVKYGDQPLPQYDITLTDNVEVVLNQIGQVAEDVEKLSTLIAILRQSYGKNVWNELAKKLSKTQDDTAAGYITMLKGLQIGANFVPDILGEGGVLRMREDGKVELVTDILYARMKAYFDTVEVREYQHTGGNRIASVAGNRMCRVEWYDANNEVLEQTQANLASVAYFRCYFRASDGEDTVRNNWVVGDLAYCHITSIANGSDNPEQKDLNQKHLWRLVIGRNTDNVLTEDGEAYIDLSNRSTETISSVSYAGYQSGSDTPAAQDDIIQLGNVNDTTRQGAIVEFVTGTDAPSYQIYQGINSFSLSNKNQITIGYNTATGKADMKVYGDAYIGARDRSTFIEYKQDDGTQQHAPILNIKAVMQTLPSSTYEGKSASQFVQDNQIKYDNAIAALIRETEDLQAQIDGAIESYFMTGAPSLTTPPVMNSGGSTYAEPWLDGTETQEERIAILNKHIGDLYYDKATGHGYRFMYDSDNSAYVWTILTDEDVTEALALAAQAQATADGKSTTFLNNTSDQDETKRYPKNYKKGDTWILQVDATINGVAYKAGDILTTSADSTTYNAAHWSKQVRYTDDTRVEGFITELLNGSSDTEGAMTAAIKAIRAAMNNGVTTISGGLVLSNQIMMRDTAATPNTWSGISGMFDSTARGNGVAIWAGGAGGDWESYYDSLTPEQKESAAITSAYGKSLFRFDGSGYLAGGNITWDATGRVTIKDLHTDDGGTPTDVLQEMSAFRGMFDLSVWASATRIKPLQNFEQLKITRPSGYTITDSDVLTRNESDARYMVTDRFKALFRVYNGNLDITDSFFTNGLPSDTSSVSIKAMFDFWSQGGITALGQGSQGGGGGAGVLYELNDVVPNQAGNQVSGIVISDGQVVSGDGYVLTFSGSQGKWIASPTAETYVLPQATANTLGGIKIGYSGTGKNYPLVLNNDGQAYVNVPWTDHYAWGDISNKPTTISGYGITDAYTKTQVDSLVRLKSVAFASDGVLAFELQDGSMSYTDLTHQHDFQEILDKPTTLAGFGITDAKIESGVITLGGNTITPVTSVAMTVPTGLSISGTPISKTGTFALSYSSGYEGFTTELKNMITALYSWFEVDSNGDIKTKDYTSNGTTKHRGFWSPTFISALGQGSDGGGGGTGDVTWELLKSQATNDRYIHLSYISTALASYLAANNYIQSSAISDMATKTWVGNQGYLTQQSLSNYYTKSQVDALARLTNVAYSSDGILAFTHQDGSTTYADFTHEYSFLELLDKPTTIAGYEISDAYINNGVVYLGNNSITPVTSVAMTVPTGFSISGSPISKTGTLAVSYASGYEGFTTSLKEKIEALFSWFELDSDGNVKTKDYYDNGTTKHRGFWSESFISALGEGNDGGGGGQGDVTWELLKQADTRPINISHLTGALSGYATQSWVTSQGYVTTSGMNTAINALTYLNSVSLNNDGSIVFGGHGIENTIVDLSHQHSFQELTYKPTTIAGYGITDVYSWARQSTKPSYAFSEITGTATANQIPSIQNINSFGTYVYSAQISRTANTVLAAPNGSAGVASFRSLVAADIPSLDWSKIGSGKPTTLSGYGITDACTQSTANGLLYTMSLNNDGTINVITLGGTTKYSIDFTHQHSFLELVDRPTTTDGYGITGGKMTGNLYVLGNVGIGTSSPSYKLHVNGESYFANWMFVNSSVTALGIELQPSSSSAGHGGHIDFHYNKSSADYTTRLIEDASGRLKLIGDFYATGGVTALVATSSDIRKKNVVSYDLPLTLNQIADAPTIKFTWKDKPNLGEQVGSIAQYWQKVLPQTIRTEKDDTLSLQYGVAALLSTIVVAKKVVNHEQRISELEKECERLKTENEQLKMMIA